MSTFQLEKGGKGTERRARDKGDLAVTVHEFQRIRVGRVWEGWETGPDEAALTAIWPWL